MLAAFGLTVPVLVYSALLSLPVLFLAALKRSVVESIEIWLAADYHYLPVRIRYFDRRGKFFGEQVASEVRISEE